MSKRNTEDDLKENPNTDAGQGIGPVDVIRILHGIKESETPQLFGIKKGGSITANIEVKDGVAYFGACDGNFYAVDAMNGKEMWRFSSGEIFSAFKLGDDALYASCFDHSIYAIGFDGKLKWRFIANGKIANDPCISGDKIYATCEDGNLYCVDKNDGKLIWRYSTNAPSSAIPAAHNGMVMFGNFTGNFFAVDENTGSLIWKFTASGGVGGGLVHDGVIYLPCLNKTLYALDLKGNELWRYKSNKSIATSLLCNPYNDMVFIGSRQGGMKAISTINHDMVWEFPTQEMVLSYSATEGGILYFGSCDNKFYAVDAETGKLIWSFNTNGPNVGGCSVHDGRVYFGSWDCNAYCLDAKTGNLLWKFHTSMSNMSDYEVDMRTDKPEFSVVPQTPETEKGSSEVKEKEDFADYGEFSGSYMGKDKSDYVSSGKRSYIKKKDF